MEHYKSTLATTAVAAFGLVVAAHILHPGNYETQPRLARAPVPVASVATAWVDPPADLRAAAAAIRVADASEPGDAAAAPGAPSLLAPRMVAAPAPGATMAPTLPSTMARPPLRAQKAAGQRRRLVQRARTRQASLDRGTVPAASEPPAAAPAKPGIDPIGDLIRGLGFGGQG